MFSKYVQINTKTVIYPTSMFFMSSNFFSRNFLYVIMYGAENNVFFDILCDFVKLTQSTYGVESG